MLRNLLNLVSAFMILAMIWFILTWTAPGNDGNQGQAAEYDVRLATVPITAENWNTDTCIQIPNVPYPLTAGFIQVCTVWCAIITTDTSGNKSELSNLAMSVWAQYPCADVNGDGHPIIDILDLMYLIDYMFREGPPPNCRERSIERIEK